MSSDSDLSDLSEFEGPEAGANKRRRKGSEYKITNALQQPHNSSFATVWLNTLIKEGDIKLNPEYQRDVVWTDAKQSKLIDSLLRNYYIPPVIFSLSTDANGNQTRVCIDGKQRLTSIHRFLEGHIPHKDGGTSYYFQQADPSKSCRLLPENLRRQFRNKTIICVEYRDLDGTAERVQLGMALTTGETFQSYEGPIAKFIHQTHSQLFEEDRLDDLLRLSIDRGKGFQGLVRTVACIAKLPDYVHVSQLQQSKLLQKHNLTEEENNQILRKSKRALDIIRDIASDPQLREKAFPLPARTSRTSPVEFCFSTLLVAIRMDRPGITTPQLAEQIGDMNATMRAMHIDMRTNNKVSQSFWEYINDQIPIDPTPSVSSQATVRPSESEPTSPKAKRIRVNGPMTPQTPSVAANLITSETPLASKRKSAAVTPRSESAAQFYKVFGSVKQEP
ncbi:hypothetical protein BN14_01138 [Rhizoctonia solani AG-1 IB]|uniref:GmrSD restriction endonucleases N-terminal domain-containing protein n=1 Tax=Thanatephorus cucumeris (strain AG1-IB / isolate 7/3/14) TaxID=1108050 RepID=M5BK75_THACB|nr:hypothetical protein BN14_01138 [Rhizoctonia solani AG-1 IB]